MVWLLRFGTSDDAGHGRGCQAGDKRAAGMAGRRATPCPEQSKVGALARAAPGTSLIIYITRCCPPLLVYGILVPSALNLCGTQMRLWGRAERASQHALTQAGSVRGGVGSFWACKVQSYKTQTHANTLQMHRRGGSLHPRATKPFCKIYHCPAPERERDLRTNQT